MSRRRRPRKKDAAKMMAAARAKEKQRQDLANMRDQIIKNHYEMLRLMRETALKPRNVQIEFSRTEKHDGEGVQDI